MVQRRRLETNRQVNKRRCVRARNPSRPFLCPFPLYRRCRRRRRHHPSSPPPPHPSPHPPTIISYHASLALPPPTPLSLISLSLCLVLPPLSLSHSPHSLSSLAPSLSLSCPSVCLPVRCPRSAPPFSRGAIFLFVAGFKRVSINPRAWDKNCGAVVFLSFFPSFLLLLLLLLLPPSFSLLCSSPAPLQTPNPPPSTSLSPSSPSSSHSALFLARYTHTHTHTHTSPHLSLHLSSLSLSVPFPPPIRSPPTEQTDQSLFFCQQRGPFLLPPRPHAGRGKKKRGSRGGNKEEGESVCLLAGVSVCLCWWERRQEVNSGGRTDRESRERESE